MIRSGSLCLAVLTLCAACGSVPVEQREIPPPRPERSLRTAESTPATDEAATQRFLDAEIEKRDVQAPRPTNAERYRISAPGGSADVKTDESATQLFLDHEIARRTYVPPVPQAEQVTERVYVDQQLYQQQYDHYRSSFPWHTAVGAGIGAIIGNQSDHLEEGAWIGAGVGFLMDAFRLH